MYLIFIGSLKKGGVERFAALLANYLVDRGEKVKMLMLKEEISFDLDKRVELEVIDYKKSNLRVFSFIYVYFCLFLKVWTQRPKRLITLARITGLFASATFYPRTIVSFDTYPLTFKKYKQYQYWFFYNLPWVRRIVSCSEELKADVSPYILSKSKMVTIPYPVPKISIPRTEVHSRDFFVVVSRLHSQKNIRGIVETFDRFKLKQHADLIICGDGPEMENLKDYVAANQLSEHVFLKGFVRDPYPYLKSALSLVSASMREGFPNVFVESLGLGTPVISSRAKTGPSEIIFDGENGLLFNVDDYNHLGKLMTDVATNSELLQHLRSNVSKGLDRYSYQVVMEKWIDELK